MKGIFQNSLHRRENELGIGIYSALVVNWSREPPSYSSNRKQNIQNQSFTRRNYLPYYFYIQVQWMSNSHAQGGVKVRVRLINSRTDADNWIYFSLNFLGKSNPSSKFEFPTFEGYDAEIMRNEILNRVKKLATYNSIILKWGFQQYESLFWRVENGTSATRTSWTNLKGHNSAKNGPIERKANIRWGWWVNI